MKLPELLKILPEYQSSAPEVEVLSLTHDARQVHLGSVFVAVPGTSWDGHQFLNEACAAGAIALVVEREDLVPANFTGFVQKVKGSREALDLLASQFYQHPSMEMACFGVTGTNGKTSVTYLLEAILEKFRFPCGVLGTINHHLGSQVWPTNLTTPDAVSLQKRLREMKEAGAKAVAMEISSHALDQARADGVHFNTVIFTNLSRDHLDYHESMKDYFQAKQKLFTDLLWNSRKNPHFAIVNSDDPWGAKMRVAASASLWTYGTKKNADFRYEIQRMDFNRTDFILKTPLSDYQSFLPMCGTHNVANAVAAAIAASTIGIPIRQSLEALTRFHGVPGRLQLVPNSRSLHVFVDYAHSPDALENVLKALNKVRTDLKSHSQIWTIFGCGGDRDKGKRPQMAEIAIRLSDFVMVTSDNPRTEDPYAIINDIMDGFTESERKKRVEMQVDRKKAIETVFKMAKPHDVILIAGKGHEDYQIIGKEKIHFSDFETAKELLL
ncbi:MAG: UDP-N-acetylmuramoyl-L-alanyl-D-glutamate--2,6-diaminopimelate ligase [Pseudobdellovibrionaceae bacterium]